MDAGNRAHKPAAPLSRRAWLGTAAGLSLLPGSHAWAQIVDEFGSSALKGAGSTFVHPLMAAWAQEYRVFRTGGVAIPVAGGGLDDDVGGVALDYEAVGSQASLARGTFTVDMKPQGEPNAIDGVSTGRMALNKRFEGDLVAVGQGEMLTALTPIKGSAGYVAIERVTGTLQGRSGSFVFQHSGTMNQGAQQLSIGVVPGSGTGGLAGIAGVFRLTIAERKHHYEFEYALPAAG